MQFLKFALAAISVGSAVAVPVQEVDTRSTKTYTTGSGKGSTTVVSSLLEVVSGLTVVVDKELVSVNTSVIGGVVNSGVVPLVNTALANVIVEVNDVLTVVTSLVGGVVLPLVDAELKNVPALLREVLCLVRDIEATVFEVVGAVTAGKISL